MQRAQLSPWYQRYQRYQAPLPARALLLALWEPFPSTPTRASASTLAGFGVTYERLEQPFALWAQTPGCAFVYRRSACSPG